MPDMMTAQHTRIAEVVAGNVEASDGVPRINVIGVVVGVQDEAPPAFMVDDRSALVLVRQFDDSTPPVIGSVVCVIGRIREHAGEYYVASEIVKKVDSRWLAVRSLELAKQASFTTPTMKVADENVEDVTDADSTVLGVIRKLDQGTGASMDDILSDAGADAEKVITVLLERGDVFEVSPGRIKVLE